MRIQPRTTDLPKLRADLAVCFAWEGDLEPSGVADAPTCRTLGVRMKAERFRGRPGDVLSWTPDGALPSLRVLVVGLGKRRTPEALRNGAARATRSAETRRARTVALRLPAEAAGEDGSAFVRAAVEGVRRGAYRFDRYLTDADAKPPRITAVQVASDLGLARARRAVAAGDATGAAIDFARDLVNEPPSTMNPVEMTRRIRAMAKDAGLRVRVLGEPELRRLGMGAMLAVARGSSAPPRLVHLTYKPPGKAGAKRRKLVLVGKGVTFDSGGLNLKPSASMLDMKCDMAGAAAVAGAMSALGDLGCPVEVHGLVGLVENMTGASAYKPGDILKTYLGKTVEIGNTDAEGRLVLADVLAYAAKTLKPDAMIDLATLTGACVVALGTRATGLFTRDEALRDGLLAASDAAGEKVWPMPMYEEYLESLQGGPADLRNVGDRWGGAITAALFLGEFVPDGLAWAHLDIAGPAFREKASPDSVAGGSGAAVPTVLRWIESAGGGRR